MTQRFRKITPDKFKKPAPEPYRGPMVSLSRLIRSTPDDDFNRLESGGTLRKADPITTPTDSERETMQTTQLITSTTPEGALLERIAHEHPSFAVNKGRRSSDPHVAERQDIATLVKTSYLRPEPAFAWQAGAAPAPATKVDRVAKLAEMMKHPERYSVLNGDGTLNKVATEIRISQALGGDQRGAVAAFCKVGDDAVALLRKKK